MTVRSPGRILISAAAVHVQVRELVQIVSRDYAGRDLLVVCVLNGAAIFWADLSRLLEIPCQHDFVAIET